MGCYLECVVPFVIEISKIIFVPSLSGIRAPDQDNGLPHPQPSVPRSSHDVVQASQADRGGIRPLCDG